MGGGGEAAPAAADDQRYFTERDIHSLYHILPVENLASVLEHGLLSHKRAARIEHADVADSEVQDIRAYKPISRPPRPDGAQPKDLTLHQCVPFYLNPHNAMMAVRREQHQALCVLRVRKELLNRGDEVFSSVNAARRGARFFNLPEFRLSPATKMMLTHEDSQGGYIKDRARKAEIEAERRPKRQAEALFPYTVKPSFIFEIHVSNRGTGDQVLAILRAADRRDIRVIMDPRLFFQDPADGRYHGKYARWGLLPSPPPRGADAPELDLELPTSSESEEEDISPRKRRLESRVRGLGERDKAPDSPDNDGAAAGAGRAPSSGR